MLQSSQASARVVGRDTRGDKLIPLAMGLFFAFGFCTVLVDTLIPRLKAIFSLSYTEVMLTQFCYFLAYFLISGPAGWLIARIGYLRAVTAGLLVMVAGCALFTPAAASGQLSGLPRRPCSSSPAA